MEVSSLNSKMSLANEVISKDLKSTSSSRPAEAEKKRIPGYWSILRAFINEFLAGLKDSVQVLNTFSILIVSKRSRGSFVKLAVINMIMYNGWVWIFRPPFCRIYRGLNWLCRIDLDYYSKYVTIVVHILSYFISFLYFSQVAEDTLRLQGKQIVPPNDPFRQCLRFISQKIYRVLLVCTVVLQIWLLSLIPRIGIFFKFSLFTIIYGYYCYEYKWELLGASLAKRLTYLEDSVCYLSGFGFVGILLGMMCPQVVEWGIFPSVVMTNVILASMNETVRSMKRIPVLCLPNGVIRGVLKCCNVVCYRSQRTNKVKAN